MTWQTVELLKTVFLTGTALGLIPVLYLRACNRRVPTSIDHLLFCLLISAGIAGYFNFGKFHGSKYPNSVHYYDFYHYYFGAKYASELGYDQLYAATVLADHEGEKRITSRKSFKNIRDLDTNSFIPWRDVLKHRGEIKGGFSRTRWQEFCDDVRSISEQMPKNAWPDILKDLGFNGTPVWLLVARPLSNLVGISKPWHVVALAWIDVLLMLSAFVLLYRAFGIYVLTIAILLFGLNYFQRYNHISGSFLRLDWLSTLLIGVSLIRLNRPGTGGAFLAYSALLRIFPVVYLAGPVVRFVHQLISHRSLPRHETRVLGGATMAATVLLLLSLVQADGVRLWRGFVHDIIPHSELLTVKRIALPYIFAYTGERSDADLDLPSGDQKWQALYKMRQDRISWYSAVIWAIRIVAVSAFIYAAMRLNTLESILLGISLVFFFLNPVRYYWAQLIVVVPLLVPLIRQINSAILLSSLFLIMVVMYAVNLSTTYYNLQQFIASVLLGIWFAYLLIWMCIRKIEDSTAESIPEPTPIEIRPQASTL